MLTPNYKGIAIDPRSDEQKALDYKHEDLIKGDVILNWIDFNQKNLKSFEIQNQDGSLSCVGQATSKILAMHEVLEGRPYKRLCPKFIYTRRDNYPDGGMWLPNALDIGCKFGSCEESVIPCDDKNEAFMNDKKEPVIALSNAARFKGKYYFEITNRNIDNIAKVIESGYGVLLGCRFDYDEWTDVPTINPNSKNTVGHGIAAVDYVMYEGKKALVIEDSWGPHYGKGGRRVLTEDFLAAKCFYAGYITSLKNFVFTLRLALGSTGLEVKALQEKLGVKVDGKFGPLTRKAVVGFQYDNGLIMDGIVGPKTREKLNK